MSGRKKNTAHPVRKKARGSRTPTSLDEVTEMERIAIDEFLANGFNKTQALIAAGYSKDSAHGMTSRVFNRDRVRSEIRRRAGHLLQQTGIRQQEVLEELVRIAFSDLSNIADWNGSGFNLKDSSSLTPEQLSSIAEIVVIPNKYGDHIKVKQHSKLKALELLCKFFGLLVERREVDHTVKGSVLILPDNKRSDTEPIDVTPRKPLETKQLDD